MPIEQVQTLCSLSNNNNKKTHLCRMFNSSFS